MASRQRPPGGAPAISLRLAGPPSVEGTGGGQIGGREPGATAVVFAACAEVSGISPGNSKGACDVAEPEPVSPPAPVVPAAPSATPASVDDPDAAPDCDADDGDDADGGDDAVTDPAAVSLLLV